MNLPLQYHQGRQILPADWATVWRASIQRSPNVRLKCTFSCGAVRRRTTFSWGAARRRIKVLIFLARCSENVVLRAVRVLGGPGVVVFSIVIIKTGPRKFRVSFGKRNLGIL